MSSEFVLDFYKKHVKEIHQHKKFYDPSHDISFERLYGDMSYKQFLRIVHHNKKHILVIIPTAGSASIETFAKDHELPLSPAEAFITTAKVLAAHIAQVSPVYAVDQNLGLILLSDHGDFLLETYIKEVKNHPSFIISYFEKIFLWLKQFQILPNLVAKEFFAFHRTLEQTAMMVEIQEYIKYGLQDFKNEKLSQTALECLMQQFAELTAAIDTQPKALIHRDFQSKNIMLQDESFWIIDYQDLCYGPYSYDYASIIFDPYLDLDIELQVRLIKRCWELNFQSLIPFNDFQHDIQQCAIQRLLKAAGRYARYLHRTGKNTHMKYYQPAIDKVNELLKIECTKC